MSKDERDMLDLLRSELDFIEKGGYGRDVRTPWRERSVFRDSLSCVNYALPEKAHPWRRSVTSSVRKLAQACAKPRIALQPQFNFPDILPLCCWHIHCACQSSEEQVLPWFAFSVSW